MGTNLQSSGNGNLAIEELVAAQVTQLRGTWTVEDKGVLVSLPGNEGPEFIEFEPQGPEPWARRFRWIEKQVASAILNTPVTYAMDWKPTSKSSSSGPIVRLSLGLSLSRGALLPKRYACLWDFVSGEVTVVREGPFARGRGKAVAPPSKFASTSKYKKMFAQAIVKACTEYKQESDVQAACIRLGEARRGEYVNLDLLYRGRRTANDRLRGLPPSGAVGSAAVAAELRTLQEVVMKRYALSIQVRPLTLGVLLGNVPRRIFSR
jgi:hypothetical protein